jgi:glutamyl-tRNA reductase
MSELSAQYLLNKGARSVLVIDPTHERARELANSLGGKVARFEDRLQKTSEADIVISSGSCPCTVLRAEDVEFPRDKRVARPLVVFDLALPRNVDPSAREVPGVFLYDLDDLERAVRSNAAERETITAVARKLVEEEASGFLCRLLAARVIPTIIALRSRLDEICRQELESFKEECGPFSKDEDALLSDAAGRVIRKIAGSLARELKELPEKSEQDSLTSAVQRLFHLPEPERASAGTSSVVLSTPQ